MKAIAAKDKDGKFFGLFVNPEEGELLTTEQLEGLLPYVLHVVKENSSSAMADKIESKLVVSGQSLSFQYLSELDTQNISKLLDTVISACDSGIKDFLIVPQGMMGAGPAIKHKIMHFEANGENGIIVKFTELGAFNNFDVAMEELAAHYSSIEFTESKESTFTA